jgi:hypothetical protein
MATSKPVPGAAVAAGLCAHNQLAPGPASRPSAAMNFSFWDSHRPNETAALAPAELAAKMS